MKIEVLLVTINENPAGERHNANGGLISRAQRVTWETVHLHDDDISVLLTNIQVASSVERCDGSGSFSGQSRSHHMANAYLRFGNSIASPSVCLT